uniref:Uncharacterized protein n=1 Tax=Romanomermis culicivorax TaxID=13658 RepID=A0A915JJY0_ROMCU
PIKLQASGHWKQVAVVKTKEHSCHREDKGTYYDSAEADSLCEEDEAEAMNDPALYDPNLQMENEMNTIFVLSASSYTKYVIFR